VGPHQVSLTLQIDDVASDNFGLYLGIPESTSVAVPFDVGGTTITLINSISNAPVTLNKMTFPAGTHFTPGTIMSGIRAFFKLSDLQSNGYIHAEDNALVIAAEVYVQLNETLPVVNLTTEL